MKLSILVLTGLVVLSAVGRAEIAPDSPPCKDGKIGLQCDLEKASDDYKELTPANLKKAKVVKTYTEDMATITEYDNGRRSYTCKDRQGIERPILNNFPFTKEESEAGTNLLPTAAAKVKSQNGDDFCDSFEAALERAPSYYELILFGQKKAQKQIKRQ